MIDTTPFYSSDKASRTTESYEFIPSSMTLLNFYFSASNRKGAYADGDIQLIFTYQEDGKPVIAPRGATLTSARISRRANSII